MTTEYERAYTQMEAARNTAVDEYIAARPQLDSIHNRRIFEAGFKVAWEATEHGAVDSLRERLFEAIESFNVLRGYLERSQIALSSARVDANRYLLMRKTLIEECGLNPSPTAEEFDVGLDNVLAKTLT